MPIKRNDRGFYPIDWIQLSRSVRFERAGGRCERCARPHGQMVCNLADGRWYDDEAAHWRTKRGRKIRVELPAPADLPADVVRKFTNVSLACAHLDQDTANNAAQNLAALCQRCHLEHDRPWNLKKRRITLLLRKAVGDLFTGPYQR